MRSTTYMIHANPPGFQASVIETEGIETARRIIKTLKRAGWRVDGVVFREVNTSYTSLRPVNLDEKARRKS